MSDFWAVIEAQLTELRTAKTADDVLRILSRERDPYGPGHAVSGEGFFAGSGGDGTVMGALYRAGWVMAWSESSIYYTMRAPNGDLITYCEGDIDRGKVAGMPLT